jgi:tetratricopeptide (TPR) repeat protein
MKGTVIVVSLLCACAGPAAPASPPLQSSELPRLDGVPRLVRPADSDYVRDGALLRGGLAWDAGDTRGATTRLEAAKRAPDAPDSAWALHAWMVLDEVGPRAAESVAREGLAAFPFDPALRAVLAEALLGAAAERRTAGADAEVLLGPLLDGAQATDPYVLRLGARAALWCGATDRALHRLDRLSLSGPLDTDLVRLRARTLEAAGRHAEALPLYEQLAESGDADPLLLEEMAFATLTAARATAEVAHFDRASALLARVVELDPQHAEAWAGLAACAAARGLDADAIAAWRRVLELEPAYVPVALELADYLRAAGDAQAAEAVLNGLLLQPLQPAEAALVRQALTVTSPQEDTP